MHAGFNAVWVTWDVARFGTEITPEDLEMLRAKDHPVSNFCIRCTQSLREYDRKKFGHAGFGVIDSVIMMACLYPDLMVEPYSAYCDIEISHTLACITQTTAPSAPRSKQRAISGICSTC